MDISNIDELLTGTATEASEVPHEEDNDSIDDNESNDYGIEESIHDEQEESLDDEEENSPESEESHDEYGNKTENLSKSMQKRLERQANKYNSEIAALKAQLAESGASKQIQNAADNFEYDSENPDDWQSQLRQFIKQTLVIEEKEKERQQQEAVSRQKQAEQEREVQEFRGKFQQGMERFEDFVEVVDGQPLDSAMTAALQGIKDPAAFVYAAAKRMPQELERISKMKSPHDRYAEMIRLEQKMRTNKPMTKTPRPLGRTKEDATIPVQQKKREETIEDLIAKSDAKKLKIINARKGR